MFFSFYLPPTITQRYLNHAYHAILNICGIRHQDGKTHGRCHAPYPHKKSAAALNKNRPLFEKPVLYHYHIPLEKTMSATAGASALLWRRVRRAAAAATDLLNRNQSNLLLILLPLLVGAFSLKYGEVSPIVARLRDGFAHIRVSGITSIPKLFQLLEVACPKSRQNKPQVCGEGRWGPSRGLLASFNIHLTRV